LLIEIANLFGESGEDIFLFRKDTICEQMI